MTIKKTTYKKKTEPIFLSHKESRLILRALTSYVGSGSQLEQFCDDKERMTDEEINELAEKFIFPQEGDNTK